MNRAMFDHPIFAANPDRVAAWAWMIAKAAWKDTKQDAGGKVVTVKRGQLLTSYRQMSKSTGVSIKALRTLIERLQGEAAIGTETGTGRLLITIRNYDKYQASGEGGGTGGAQQGHTEGTQKKQVNKITTSPIGENALSAPELQTVEVSVSSSAVWNAGKPFLASRGVANPGSMIGRWLKSHQPLALLSAIEAAQKSGTQDPVPYITQILNGHSHDHADYPTHHASHRPAHRPDAALEQIARLAGLN
jgi:hypothetical protein